jgi:hypothetical protein
VAKCLAKKPEQRFASMEEVMAELERISEAIPSKIPRDRSPKLVVLPAPAKSPGPKTQIVNPFSETTPVSSQTNLIPARSRWPALVGIGGLAAAAVAAAAAVLSTNRSQSQPAGSDATPPSPDAGKAPAPDSTQPLVEPIPSVTKKRVSLSVVPSDSHIYRDGEDLGTRSAVVSVEEGATVEIEVRRRGFKTKKVLLDGNQEEWTVRLDREPGIKRPSPPKDQKKEETKPNNPPNNQVGSPWK